MEIIDLENPSFSCTNAHNFPRETRGSIGALIDNKLMICGMSVTKSEPSCYMMQYEDDPEWRKYDAMIEERSGAASGSVVLNNQLVMVGGQVGVSASGIELVSPETGTRKLKTKLPIDDLIGACMVPWDTNSIMVIGGYHNGKSMGRTYIIDTVEDNWSGYPSLKVPRYNHACQELTVNGESYIVVVGGKGVQSTEFLSKSNYEKGWKEGE